MQNGKMMLACLLQVRDVCRDVLRVPCVNGRLFYNCDKNNSLLAVIIAEILKCRAKNYDFLGVGGSITCPQFLQVRFSTSE